MIVIHLSKIEKPFWLGFAVLELNKLLMKETNYDKLQH